MTTHTLINGDSRNMSLLADESVHLIVTSPPYWQLKDYGSDQQIGFHESYESYINQLNLVWSDFRIRLHGGGYLAETNFNEYDRWRCCYGQLSLPSQRDIED